MTTNRSPTSSELDNVKQDTVQWAAKAHRTTLVDSVGEDVSVSSNEGNNVRTSNVNTESLLSSILKELKIMNLHLSILTDNTIKKTEVE